MLAKGVIMCSTLTILAQDPSNCETYEAHLQSRPDTTHKVVVAKSTLPPDFTITDVTPDTTRERSFYWCEMTVDDVHGQRKTMKRYGHNATYWWVMKGCGGWFHVTGCRGQGPFATQGTADPVETTMIVATTSSFGQHKQTALHYEDLNTGALQSLATWLTEEGGHQDSAGNGLKAMEMDTDITDELGAKPIYRQVRSVDEEFALDFGQQS